MMGSFVSVVYASLAASRTLLQWLLVCLNTTLDSEIYSVCTNEKSGFYKLLKTMKTIEVWPDTNDEGYIHQFQTEHTNKIH